MYANEDELEFGGNNTYSFLTEVTDGTMKLGVKLVNSTANYVRFDNFRLEYTNVSAEIYDAQQEVIALLEDAKAITGVMQNTVATELEAAIEEAEDALETSTLESLAAAKTTLETAVPAAIASATAYEGLNGVITEAKTMDDSGIDYSAFSEAIFAAEAVYTAATANAATVDGAVEILRDAMVDYAVANASEANPADVTRWVANPDFEENQGDRQQEIPGWTKAGSNNSEYCTRNDAGPLSGAFKTGTVYFQYWSSEKPDYSISQELTSLPDGVYTLVADAGGDAGTTGTYIYANNKEVEVTTTGSEYTVDVTVTNGTLSIGFKSVGRNVNWSYADNFRLFYKGEKTSGIDDLKEELSDSLLVAVSLKENYAQLIVKAEMNKLSAAITSGNTAAESDVYDEVSDAVEGLKIAITASRISIELCGELIPLFAEANKLIEDYGTKVDPSALQAVLDKNYNMYMNQTNETDNAALLAGKAELEAAIEAYKADLIIDSLDDVNADSGVKVYVDGSSIVVEGADYEIYTQSGIRITGATELIPGIYIVKVAGQTVKVAVK